MSLPHIFYSFFSSSLLTLRRKFAKKKRIDYHQWQILSLMPLVASFLLSFSFVKFIKTKMLPLVQARFLRLCTFLSCKVSSTSGSNYFARELRFFLSVFQSVIKQNSSVAWKESTFSETFVLCCRSNFMRVEIILCYYFESLLRRAWLISQRATVVHLLIHPTGQKVVSDQRK